MLKISRNGFAMNAHFEGIYLYAYPDPGTGGEPITIGIGGTTHDGFGRVRMGQTITLERAVARCRAAFDQNYGPAVNKAGFTEANTLQHEFDGFVSFHYNTGAIRSGSVDDKWLRGSRTAALDTLERYVNAGGRVMNGLVRRRQAERKLIETGEYYKGRIMLRVRPGEPARYISADALPWTDDIKPGIPVDTLPPVPPLPERKPVEPLKTQLLRLIGTLVKWLLTENPTPTR